MQLIVYCWVVDEDEETKTNVEYYLYCLKVGVCATARLNQFIEEHGLDWTKCKLLPMEKQHAIKVLLMKLSEKSKSFPLTVSTHCMIHREALMVRRSMQENNQRSGLKIVLDDVIKIVNFISSHSKEHWMLSEMCKDNGSRCNDFAISCWGTMIIQRKSFKAGVSPATRFAGFPWSIRAPDIHYFSRPFLACKTVLLVGNIWER